LTGRDLAQACRDHLLAPHGARLWVLCEVAIAACRLAEVIGSAIGLNLLFGIPLAWGHCDHGARRADRPVLQKRIPAARGPGRALIATIAG